MVIRHIIHLADIHIGSWADFNSSRSGEYRAVFDELGVALQPFDGPTSCVVICGDVFHFKIKLHPQDIEDFDYLMRTLAEFRVVIIPGNHDGNVNNLLEPDLLTPLVRKYANVTYFKDSGLYDYYNLKFYHLSVFDDCCDGRQIIEAVRDGPIMLYHGVVRGAHYGSYVEKQARMPIEALELCHVCLLGDIHEHQFILPTAAYSGSLIQQSMNENLAKGFVVWDLSSRTGKFHPIFNDTGLVRTDVSGMTYEGAMRHIDSIAKPQKIARWLVHYEDERIIDYIRNKWDVEPERKKIQKVEYPTNCMQTQIDVLSKLLRRDGHAADVCERVIAMHGEFFGAFNTAAWELVSMEWDNLYKYGVGNYIDFRAMSGIYSIVANNTAGKSSIFDILVIMLYNHYNRGGRRNIVKNGAKNARATVIFAARGRQYRIMRNFDGGDGNRSIQLHWRDGGDWNNITEFDVIKTYKVVVGLIGDKDEFLTTIMQIQPSEHSVVYASNAQRGEILAKIFGLTSIDKVKIDLEKKIKVEEAKIRAVPAPAVKDAEAQIAVVEAVIGDAHRAIERDNAEVDRISAQLVEHSRGDRDIGKIGAQFAAVRALIGDDPSWADRVAKIAAKCGGMMAIAAASATANATASVTARATPRATTVPQLRFNAECECCRANELLFEGELRRRQCDLECRNKAAIEAQLAQIELTLEQIKLPASAREIQRKLADELGQARRQLMASSMNLGAQTEKLSYLRAQSEIARNYAIVVPPLQAALDELCVYKNYLSNNSDFKNIVIRNNLIRVVELVNSILSSFTDFSVAYSHDKNVSFEIVRQDLVRLPIDMASNYQRHVVDLIFRHALNNVAKARMMFIDEGFDALDPHNLTRMNDLFQHIMGDYQFILIISHKIEVQQFAPRKLDLVYTATESHIVYGEPEIKHIVVPSDVYTCECGAVLKLKSKRVHDRQKRHLERMAKLAAN